MFFWNICLSHLHILWASINHAVIHIAKGNENSHHPEFLERRKNWQPYGLSNAWPSHDISTDYKIYWHLEDTLLQNSQFRPKKSWLPLSIKSENSFWRLKKSLFYQNLKAIHKISHLMFYAKMPCTIAKFFILPAM